MNHSSHARIHMVESQILTGNVLEHRLVDAMASVPRELFVPIALAGAAYTDDEIALGGGRYLLEPLVFSRMLALAEISPTDRVLDLACGLGYTTAVISYLALDVIGVDDLPGTENAAQNFAKLSIGNARTILDTPVKGCADFAPYDVIIVNGAVQAIPEMLIAQLAENGRLVAIEQVSPRSGGIHGLGKALMLTKKPGNLIRQYSFDAGVPLLSGFEAKPQFVF